MSLKEFKIDNSLVQGLTRSLTKKESIFSFSSDPLLASLVACLGLHSEIGDPVRDRFSATVGVDLKPRKRNPWKSELVTLGDDIGIRLNCDGIGEFCPLHPDFGSIFHPLSLDSKGKLTQLIIFPYQVSRSYLTRGLELVIVRDWALSSFLKGNNNYLLTNSWEIESNSAFHQVNLLKKSQIAFFGTHDLADHLLGGTGPMKMSFLDDVISAYSKFSFTKKSALISSYLMGVLLDDLAQPKWYHSLEHTKYVTETLKLIEETERYAGDIQELVLPQDFHKFMHKLRLKEDPSKEFHDLRSHLLVS